MYHLARFWSQVQGLGVCELISLVALLLWEPLASPGAIEAYWLDYMELFGGVAL